MKLIIIKKSKLIITNILVYSLILYLLTNSNLVIKSISTSVDLFIYKLIPSLFPYILITELLINSNVIYNLSFGMSKMLSRIFRIPYSSTSIILIAYLLGYPNAAKYILKLYSDKIINYNTCKKLLSFTNNASPAYILCAIGLGMFSNIQIGALLLISHFLSSILIGISYPYSTDIIQQNVTNSNSFNKISTPFEILVNSMLNSFKTMSIIFGFTVIFSLIPTIIFTNLNMSEITYGLIIGIFEITNGINILSTASTNPTFMLCAISFILSFSSLMVIMQIHSFSYKTGVKLKYLLLFKLIHGILSCIITYLLIKTNLFNIQIITDVNLNMHQLLESTININYLYLFIIVLSITLLYLTLKKKR